MRRILLLMGMWACFLPLRADSQVVQKFDGTKSATTPVFTVGDKWEVLWDSPMPVRITLLSSDGTIITGAAGVFRGSIYEPKGGKFYFQVDSNVPGFQGTMPPWHLSVVETDDSSAPAPGPGRDVTFVPPSVQPPAPDAPPASPMAAASPGASPATAPAGTPAPSATQPSPAGQAALPGDKAAAVVMIEGDKAEGTGFLVKMSDGPAVITNLHVLANNPNIRILTNTGQQITVLGLKGATDRDLACFSIKDDNYSYLEINPAIGATVQPGDDVITPGNSQGGEVVLETHGTVLGVGPQRVEFSNPIYHGNSGGPVYHTKSGKVLAVVTEAIQVDNSDALSKVSFANRDSAIKSAMRYFGLRVDTVPSWEPYDMARYQNETVFLDQFHEQSRRLDSYLNSSSETDNNASDSDSGVPSSKLYLTDEKICKAQDEFTSSINGADADQRLDACREWLFAMNNIVDQNTGPIQDPNNFYQFDQQRAREESAYRKALKDELDSLGNDLSRIQGVAHKN
jgi:S1-C subfamily serine protease